MFANTFGRGVGHLTADRPERRNTRFPTERVGKYTRRHVKLGDVFGNIVRLNNILGISVGGFSPAAQFDVKFASDLIRSPFIPGEQSQNGGTARDERCPARQTGRCHTQDCESVPRSHRTTVRRASPFEGEDSLFDRPMHWPDRTGLCRRLDHLLRPNNPVIAAEVNHLRDDRCSGLAHCRHGSDHAVALLWEAS